MEPGTHTFPLVDRAGSPCPLSQSTARATPPSPAHRLRGPGRYGEDCVLGRYKIKNRDYRAYTYGALATEYIVASVGIEPLMNIWTLAGQGASFEGAVEEALGVSVQDSYAAYDAMVESMVMG